MNDFITCKTTWAKLLKGSKIYSVQLVSETQEDFGVLNLKSGVMDAKYAEV